jgi:hypothetical protein
MKSQVQTLMIRMMTTTLSLLWLFAILNTSTAIAADTRTLESHFALSADLRSEFTTRFPVVTAGRILIEVEWHALPAAAVPGALTLTLVRPDGLVLASTKGNSVLRLEHRANEPDVERFNAGVASEWTVRISNSADTNRVDVSGIVRITVPATSRVLEDTQFTLLGSGNAQEIPFKIPGPGRLDVDVSWQAVLPSTPASAQTPLTVSLIHPGEARVYARRQGPSPLRFDHQVTDIALDRGTRWVVRVQNDTQTKVKGRIKVTFAPSL